MCELLCVTNRKLCRENFLVRIEKIAAAKPKAIILREKDLPEQAYKKLAEEVQAICRKENVLCILHGFVTAAKALNGSALHLPMQTLRKISPADRAIFSVLGASCHSLEEAAEAWRLGCTYITAGHIFDTDCKKGLPGRGAAFLKKVCGSIPIPVYAIGGINRDKISEVRQAGAAGVCIMSGAMTCENVQEYLAELQRGSKI